MKTKVRVRLVAEEDVVIEVEHKNDESPTDLTAAEEAEAIRKAPPVVWCVDGVKVAE